MSRLTTALLAAVALTGLGGFAYAEMATTFDPSQLPTTKGKVAQYLPTPRGEVDGVLLDDGTEVHIPPHLSSQLVFAVHPGDQVTIHGLRARAVPMVAASSITNDATSATVVDNGPPGRHDDTQMEVTGRVKAPLHDPRGEVNGVLLADGTVIHLPPPEARRLAAQLSPGSTVTVRGDGFGGPLGKALGVREIGPDAAHLVAVAGPRPGWEHWGHEHFGHGHHGPGMHADDEGAGAPPPPPGPPPAPAQ